MLDLNCIPNCKPLNKVSNDTEGFYISYNPSARDYGSNTTAIYIKGSSQFLILNGDHSKQLNECLTLETAVSYFYNNIDCANHYSEHGMIWKTDKEGKPFYTKGGY